MTPPDVHRYSEQRTVPVTWGLVNPARWLWVYEFRFSFPGQTGYDARMVKKRGKKQRFPKDPFAEREAGKYATPIPSREFILSVLADSSQLMNREELAYGFGLSREEDIEALRRRLRAMERDGQLMVNRRGAYCLVDKMDLLRCRVQGHRDGYGFAMPLEDGEDI